MAFERPQETHIDVKQTEKHISMVHIISSKQSWYIYTRIFNIQDKFTLPENFAASEKAASLEIELK